MQCRYCRSDETGMVILPWHGDDINLQAFACEPCTQKLGIWCEKHSRVHAGFEGNGHACVLCIGEEVKRREPSKIAIAQRVIAIASHNEVDEMMDQICDWAQTTGHEQALGVLWYVDMVEAQYRVGVEVFLTAPYDDP